MSAASARSIHGNRLLDWEHLQNPVYSHEGWATKDGCMAYREGVFYLFFSAFYADEGPRSTSSIRSHVAAVSTRDFRDFTPLFNWRGTEGGETGWHGMCSPNLTQVGQTYYLTYNGWHGNVSGENNKLFFAVSTDLVHWSYHHRLAANLLRRETRAIDAAVAHHDGRYYLVYKEGQTPKIAAGEAMAADGWRPLGTLNLGWFENSQLLSLDGRWHLVATARTGSIHAPLIARMVRDGSADAHWMEWQVFHRPRIPQETWNSQQAANAAFLADWRGEHGHFYLLYSGRTEARSFAGRGDEKLGLARSPDLTHWLVPPG
jgi:predicted GH43/DUF377 family glycosyl hydrolase